MANLKLSTTDGGKIIVEAVNYQGSKYLIGVSKFLGTVSYVMGDRCGVAHFIEKPRLAGFISHAEKHGLVVGWAGI